MNRFTRVLGAALGVLLLGSIIMLIPQKNASGSPPGAPVTVENVPLPITGGVNVTNTPLPISGGVSITNTPVPILGNVSASQIGAWNVGVNNFPASQGVSFNGVAQPVSFSNTPTTPIFNRDVDNGKNPFEVTLVLDNTNPGTTPGCNIASCQANFDVPTGKRFVVEHVSARVQGATGQKYDAVLSGFVFTSIGSGAFSENLVLNFQDTVSCVGPTCSSIDVFTASQPVRAYFDESTPSPTVSVDGSGGLNFFARVSISGYLIDP